jgi:hypothetical protein
MHFYSDKLDASDPALRKLKSNWEKYVQKAVKDDLADIGGVYLKEGGFRVAIDKPRAPGMNQIVGIVAAEKKPDEEVEPNPVMNNRRILTSIGEARIHTGIVLGSMTWHTSG